MYAQGERTPAVVWMYNGERQRPCVPELSPADFVKGNRGSAPDERS